MLGRIELICNQDEGSDEVVLRARDQTIALFVVVRQHQRIPEALCLIAGMPGLDGDATASGRLLWLERSGHCFEPHVLRRLLGGIELICN
ncbi:hypothetical protein ACFQHW_02355 [Lapidilactobacillus achengensis]|uniref:Uncharacterized protein n=1 Tax=Lapidilactobacillus achengensis TaxID=2486000 RepID=A0ABW1UNG6_9LACO